MNLIKKIQERITTSEKYNNIKRALHINMQKRKGNFLLTALSRKITTKDGRELWKYENSNALLLGGAQNIIKNTFYNISKNDMTEITPLDNEPGLNFAADNITYKNENRVIFGYGIVNDGVVGLNESPVLKYQKGYSMNNLIAFQTINTHDDDVIEMHKKYAMRHVDTGTGYSMYYIKKVQTNLENITVDGNKLPNNPNENYNGKLDVTSRVYFTIKIETDELLQWFGHKYGTVHGALMNGIVLFAGRPCDVTIGGKTVETFRDVIATNRVNIADIILGDTEVTCLYELYYV